MLLGCGLLGTTPALAGGAPLPQQPVPQQPVPAENPLRPEHSSDGGAGRFVAPRPVHLRGFATQPRNAAVTRIANGVNYRTWDQVDSRGPVRIHLLRVNPRASGLRLDYARPTSVASTGTVRSLLAPRAVAGINGDFFDIGRSGAPLGLGSSRATGLLHAPSTGWNSSFLVNRRGISRIGNLDLVARIKQYPGKRITNVNSPRIAPGGIGLYTKRWGRKPGYRTVAGRNGAVRMLEIRRGRVHRSVRTLEPNQRMRWPVLVGRGAGAAQLASIRRGARISLVRRLAGRPAMAISGNRFLLDNGVSVVVDDREMHPRTAVGVDRKTGTVLMVVVDGRQSFSRGMTMVELADLMRDLGADDALNLDGGGSSTMVARNRSGGLQVLNSPSDGAERRVANGLQVLVGR